MKLQKNKNIGLLMIFFLGPPFSSYATEKSVADYVNPFIGTGSVENSLSGNKTLEMGNKKRK